MGGMNVNLASLSTGLAIPAAGGTAAALPSLGGALAATTTRDAAMPGLADATTSTNALQTIAALLAGQSPSLGSASSSASAATAAISVPPMPSAVDHGSHDETALHEDLGLADAGTDPSQPDVSA